MLKKYRKIGVFSKSGQATVEYLLLLIVIILIARFILSPLGKGLEDYAKTILGPGGYYACLMENGLLPRWDTIAGRHTSLYVNCREFKGEALSKLNQNFGDIGDPISRIDGNNPRSNNPNNRSGRGGDSNADSESDNKEKDNSQAAEKKGKGGKSSARSSDPSQARKNQTAPHLIKLKKAKKKRVKKTRAKGGSDLDDSENEFKNPKRPITKRKKKFSSQGSAGFLGSLHIEEEEEKRPPVFRALGSVSKTQVESAKKQNSFITESKRGPDQGVLDEEKGFQLGNFLKYFLIAAMIIALLLVIFSQVMEFQNRD